MAVKSPDKTATPSVASKAKESEPSKDKTAASEPKKARSGGPDLTLPDEDKPKKVAAADKPTPEPKAPADKPAAVDKPSGGGGGEGWLRLGSKPWTNIVVDGKETGLHTPQTHLKLGRGRIASR